MKLIIAEKPDLGRDIAKAVDGQAKEKAGTIEKGNYIVVWAFGHLFMLKPPEAYDNKYAKWTLDDLPIYFNNWETVPDPNKAERVNQIGKLLSRKDIECVINAGDPDEEGQLLIDEILRHFDYNGPVYRLDTGDTTTPSLKRALANLKDNKPLESLGWSAYARSVADLTVGVNLSRFFTIKNMTKLSVGRVQTPTLGLVVKRDLQIEGHSKVHYYELFVDVNIDSKVISCKYVPAKSNPNLSDGKILNQTVLEEIFSKINKSQQAVVTMKNAAEAPPLPFNLVKLQSYCGRKYKYSPTQVMEITQSLRQNHHAITYNRSDCQYLTEEHYKQAPTTLAQTLNNLSITGIPGLDTSIKGKAFNDSNITAHFAIIPTDNPVNLDRLTTEERDVYIAVATFYLIQFLPMAESEKRQLIINLDDGASFTASSTLITKSGYKDFLSGDDSEENENDENIPTDLNSIAPTSYQVSLDNHKIEAKETKPPARYTESTLNEDMTRISKYVTNPEIKQLLLDKDKDKKGENGSIGTSATRGSIIHSLIDKGFLANEKNKLISTSLGRAFYSILPTELTEPDMTAKWYVIQEDIKNGSEPSLLTESVLDACKEIMSKEYRTIPRDTIANCPLCNSPVYDLPKNIKCSNPDCNFILWKNVCGKTLPLNTLQEIISKHCSPEIKGFISNKETIFNATLELDISPQAQEKKCFVRFRFNKDKTKTSNKTKYTVVKL